MARKSYTFPDDVTLDPHGRFGVERAPGGWVAFNNSQNIGLGSARLWTSPTFNTDSEAMMVRNQAVRIAGRKLEADALKIISTIEPKRGNRVYTAQELEGEARATLADKVCAQPLLAKQSEARDTCLGALAYSTWGVRVQPSGTTVVGIAQCSVCGRVTAAEKEL